MDFLYLIRVESVSSFVLFLNCCLSYICLSPPSITTVDTGGKRWNAKARGRNPGC